MNTENNYTPQISLHALERFKERYPNIYLDEDFYNIAITKGIKQTAINRKGHIVKNEGKGIYRCIYKDIIIEYVLSYPKNNNPPVICTFNCPPKNMDDVCYSYKVEK